MSREYYNLFVINLTTFTFTSRYGMTQHEYSKSSRKAQWSQIDTNTFPSPYTLNFNIKNTFSFCSKKVFIKNRSLIFSVITDMNWSEAFHFETLLSYLSNLKMLEWWMYFCLSNIWLKAPPRSHSVSACVIESLFMLLCHLSTKLMAAHSLNPLPAFRFQSVSNAPWMHLHLACSFYKQYLAKMHEVQMRL